MNFTNQEYRLLVEMVYLADWMMHANDFEILHPEYAAVKEKLFSQYKEMAAEDLIEYFKEQKGHFITAKHEEALHDKFITPYNDQLFWEELLGRLAERDLIKQIGLEKYKTLNVIEKISRLEELKEKYGREFEKHDLANLKIENVENTI